MAVYYVSPYTTTNGTGTWASPLSANTNLGRPTLASGDEIRIVSKYLTDMLTTTVYTATYTSPTALTITAGGGLGADFAAWNVIYLPDNGTFAKVVSVSGNVINFNASIVIPWLNTSSSQTNITVRRVDFSVVSSLTTNNIQLWGVNIPNSVTITDGWVDDNVRITDGTAKTLINTTSTQSTINTQDNNAAVSRTGCVIDLANTHCMPGNVNNSSSRYRFFLGGSAYTLGQLFQNSANQAIEIGSNASPYNGGSITIKHYGTFTPLQGISAKNCTLNFDNIYLEPYENLLYNGNLANPYGIVNCTINMGNIVGRQSYSYNRLVYGLNIPPNTFNFNGVLDVRADVTPVAIAQAFGPYTVNFGSSFVFYKNQRASTVTSYTNRFSIGGDFGNVASDVVVPTVNLPPSTTITGQYAVINGTAQNMNASSSLLRIPRVCKVTFPSPSANGYPLIGTGVNVNYLFVFTDGSAPIELLTPYANPYGYQLNNSQTPTATTDSSVFRTAAPSLRTTLTTRLAGAFSDRESRARKTIKIPVVSGQSYTVSGYIRNNITSFANGDVRMCIANTAGAEVVGQNMTTASNGAWEQFTLTFTASETAEYHLVIEMYFINAGSIWLDDLTIT